MHMTDRILKWILSVKNRKTAFLFCYIMLALSGGCSAPETEEASRNDQNPEKETVSVTEQNDEKSINTAQLNKEDISNWITAELTGSEPQTTAENIREWEKANQGGFYKYWRKTVLKQIKGWEDIEDYKKTAEDIIKSCSIYKKICGSGKEVEALLQNAEIISVLAEDNEKIQNKYQIDIMAKRDMCVFQTHYIERQLEMNYSDNLAGKLQEEIESYQPDEYLDWLAYNVEYWMDEPICGDTCQMVIRTKTNEPFARAGAYYLAYMDTGKTMPLIDSRGFRQEVPVCQLLGDGNIVENDFSQYVSNVDTCFSLCQKTEQLLKTGSLENSQEYADSETNTDSNNSLDHSDSSDDLGDIGQYYIIYDSNQRFLDDWDFDDMDSHTLCLARNEIYARHGRLFNDNEIQEYFNSMPWYTGIIAPEDFDDRVFNQYEKANLEKIGVLESYTAP
jgi:hypothetical protein